MIVKGTDGHNFDIQDFSFDNLGNDDNPGGIREFSIPDLSVFRSATQKKQQDIIRKERAHAKAKNFAIAPIVKRYRGIKDQENSEYDERVNNEVEKKLKRLESDAFQKGMEEGREQGKAEIISKLEFEAADKIKQLEKIIEDVRAEKSALFNLEKNNIYTLIRTLTKWVIKREINNDDKYLERLLKQMIVELRTQSNILIRVNEKWFEKMPEVLATLEKEIGKLENCRVEIDYDQNDFGILLESSNSLIDGSIESQFKSIDHVFELVFKDQKDNDVQENLGSSESELDIKPENLDPQANEDDQDQKADDDPDEQ